MMAGTNRQGEVILVIGNTISSDFGSYQIKELKGEGVFGRVARCSDLSTNRDVALKISKFMKLRATRYEANILHELLSVSEAKNIVTFVTSFAYQNQYCLVMELLDQSLSEFMKSREFKPIHVSDIRYIAEQLLVAFKELSKRGLVHADLKPSNVMLVDHKREPFRIKLIDFGLTKRVKSLVPGVIMQPLGYRAPEVSLGSELNQTVDMWSLGCVLAFLYLGQNLFPCHCEYEMVRIITQIRGLPDPEQLEKGLFTHLYLRKSDDRYEMCPQEDYSAKLGKNVKPCKNWSKNFTCLEDMMEFHPKPVLQLEKLKTMHFFDLLKLIFEVNPAKRITPEKALKHSFIKQEAARKMAIKRYLQSVDWFLSSEDEDTFSDSSSEDQFSTAGTSNNNIRKFSKNKSSGKSKAAFVSDSEDETTAETTRNKKLCEKSHPSVVGRMYFSSSSSGSEDECDSCPTVNQLIQKLTESGKPVTQTELGRKTTVQSSDDSRRREAAKLLSQSSLKMIEWSLEEDGERRVGRMLGVGVPSVPCDLLSDLLLAAT
ncbi:homeodomain-interacting protein kinase 2-like [Boleophthalmus pectinirostris]|uniref:homeodomain-interacting protein kinase 2-like n=1 Tax=Boleophthalmus pectinirostris TaxID=150288 RepID=UPI0024321A8C|nr:homeodomain-interacting protein kinase 2-like [Boleophthalmus pectinirostris]